MDYGRPVEFGYFPIPNADDHREVVQQVRLADELGLELVGVQDHPYQRRHLDTLMLLAALAATTSRVRLFPDVANLPLRHPAVLAKSAATLDILSGGRFELGLGAGAFWDAIWAMGGPRRDPGEAVAALEEAIAVIRALWSGGRGLQVAGTYYQLRGVNAGPVPAHEIGIWLGAYGPRMLALTGRLADGWLPSSAYAPPEKLAGMQARIDDAAIAAGRDPAAIRRLYNLSGIITSGGHQGWLEGPVEHWVQELTGLAVNQGVDGFIYWPSREPSEQLHRFATEVAPQVRAAVAAARGTPA
jgi:alkanesulfonate monooxygenase SsuD/methylene tetrahydromethanopterin reductase-like flavin-dependent oxidoreductase (luciferase family)